jgi:tetratricopeptide (TPR) repeat protein
MTQPLAKGDVLRRFLDRIERDLAAEPLKIDPGEHRTLLARLLAVAGSGTHYELLGVAPHADEAEVHDAFRGTARTVHPLHAEGLGLGAREGVLQLLFERATEAYLVLSDPHRRDEYDRVISGEVGPARDPAERAAESGRVARELHDRARDLMAREDYHFAVELLRQAVRLDPRSFVSWVLLGRAQKANPKWLHMASDSLRQAVRLEPESIEARLLLAEVEIARGDDQRAEALLREVLEHQPGQEDAVDRLEEIEAKRRDQRERAGKEGGRRRWKLFSGGDR